MALQSNGGNTALLTFNMTGTTGGMTAAGVAVGILPVGYRVHRISIDTAVAGTTGSSSPKIGIGITGTLGKYLATTTDLTVSVGVASYTVVGSARATAPETILLSLTSGTVTTNALYDAMLVIELIRA